MSLIMVINEEDFVMLSADHRVTIGGEGIPDTYEDTCHKIVATPFGLVTTFGAEDLGDSIKERLKTAEIVEAFDIQEMIIEERAAFAELSPECTDDLKCAGVVATYCFANHSGVVTQSRWLHPHINDRGLTKTGRLNAIIPADVAQHFMMRLTEGMVDIWPLEDRESKIHLCAALLTRINAEVHAMSPKVSPGCDIAVQLEDNSIWSCQPQGDRFELIAM
jgi:hypothetical protein